MHLNNERKLTKVNNFIRGLCFPKLATLCITFISSAPVLAATPEIISFEQLGYSRSVVLNGISPEFSVNVPKPKAGLDPGASFVRLRLEPSPSLNDDSSVRLLLNGEPVKVVSVKSLRAEPTVTLPLPTLPPGVGSVDLSIQPYLFISRNFCQDLQSGNLFLTIGKDSFFQLVPQASDQSIVGFFQSSYSQVTLTVPSNLNQSQAQSALWLYGVLAYQFGTRQIPILWQQGQSSPAQNSAQVILHTQSSGPDLEYNGTTLRVKATPQAVQALATRFAQPALVGRGLTVEAAQIEPRIDSEQPAQNRSFKELGFNDSPRRGIGAQAFRLNFDLAQLGGRPKDLTLSLNSTFTPVEPARGERLNAQIYLNGNLIQTYNLGDQTKLRDTLALPAAKLRRSNNLDIVFTYTPSEGSCQAAPTNTTIQIDGDSNLSWSDYQGPTGDLSDLPHRFLQSGQVIVDFKEPTLFASTAYLLGVISRLGRQPVLPQLIDAKTIGDWSNLPKDQTGKAPDWRLVALAPQKTPFPAPIHLEQQSFEIYNPLNQQQIFKARPTDSIGILQYFSYQQTPTLWLSWWGPQAKMAEELSQALADPRTLLANQLNGNVVTATGPNQLQTWDLSERALKVSNPDSLGAGSLVRRYRSLLIALGLILGAVVTWQIYRRLGRPPVSATPVSTPVKEVEPS